MNVISAEQAIAEGSTPEQMIMIAEWHENRARVIGKVLKDPRPGKKIAFGDRVTETDRDRYAAIAREVRAVSREMEILLQAAAA